MGAEKLRRTQLIPDGVGGFVALQPPGAPRLIAQTGVVVVPGFVGLKRERLLIGGKTVAVPQASDFGGTQLAAFPARDLQFLGARLVGSVTVDANLATALAAGTIDIGVGTVVASNTTLATTMIDLVAKIDVPASGIIAGGGVTGQAATGDAIFFNVSGACTVDAVLTIAPGTYLDLFFLDTGA